jgi:hypothetical protein
MGVIVFDLGVSLLSAPILFVFRIWAHDSAFRGITKKNRKKIIKEHSWLERFRLLFLLEYRNAETTKRYIVYYYGYLWVVVVLMLGMWLLAHEIINYDRFRWLWVFKLLLDTVISWIYLRQTRPK